MILRVKGKEAIQLFKGLRLKGVQIYCSTRGSWDFWEESSASEDNSKQGQRKGQLLWSIMNWCRRGSQPRWFPWALNHTMNKNWITNLMKQVNCAQPNDCGPARVDNIGSWIQAVHVELKSLKWMKNSRIKFGRPYLLSMVPCEKNFTVSNSCMMVSDHSSVIRYDFDQVWLGSLVPTVLESSSRLVLNSQWNITGSAGVVEAEPGFVRTMDEI